MIRKPIRSYRAKMKFLYLIFISFFVFSCAPKNAPTLKEQVLRPEAADDSKNETDQNAQRSADDLHPQDGEITLYNRSSSKNTAGSSFNFQFSTSNNIELTNNSWDVEFNSSCDSKPTLQVPVSQGSTGGVVLFDDKKFNEINRNDFPTLRNYRRLCEALEVDSIYGVFHHHFGLENKTTGRSVYGLFKVIALDKDAKWVKLKFHRIAVSKPEHFLEWIEEMLPQSGIKKLSYKFDLDPYGSEYPNYDRIMFLPSENADHIVLNNRLYEKERGAFNLGSNIDPNKISKSEIESKIGKFKNKIDFAVGDVIAVYIQNYYSKAMLLIRIDEHVKGQHIKISTTYVEQAIAFYYTNE